MLIIQRLLRHEIMNRLIESTVKYFINRTFGQRAVDAASYNIFIGLTYEIVFLFRFHGLQT